MEFSSPPSENARSPWAILAFAASALIAYPLFLPNLRDIWVFDEVHYINNGRLLCGGHLPAYASNPCVALFWALMCMPFRDSPYWMIHAASVGRFALFILLWLGAYRLAREMSRVAHPAIMIGLLIVVSLPAMLLANSSDALFSALASLGLWQFLVHLRTDRLTHLRASAALVALSALSRNDGALLFAVLIGSSLLAGTPARRRVARALACVVPFVGIVGGYVLLSGVTEGRIRLGIARRSYHAFEQAQGVAYVERYRTKDPFCEGRLESRRLYGSGADNRTSIINAARRNPHAFLARVAWVTRKVPRQVVHAYSSGGASGVGVALLLLAAAGVVHLVSRRAKRVLLALLAWPVHLVVYFCFFFRENYFLLPYYVVLLLASVGVRRLQLDWDSRGGRGAWSALLLSVSGFSAATGRWSIAVPVSLLLVGLLLTHSLFRHSLWLSGARWKPVAVALCVLLTLGVARYRSLPNAPPCGFRSLGAAPDERAAMVLRERLPTGSRVASYSPAPVVLAEMSWVRLHCGLRHLNTAERFQSWLVEHEVKAICVDHLLRRFEPVLLRDTRQLTGTKLDVAFSGDAGGTQILLVREKVETPSIKGSLPN